MNAPVFEFPSHTPLRPAGPGPLPKTHQIAKIGNSVCPVMSEALTRANFPETEAAPERNVA